MGSKMVSDESGANCVWPDKIYGCTDLNATNYDPHATALEEGEICPPGDMDWCGSCEYSSYNNTAGFTAESMPEGQLDYYGMPMNLSQPSGSTSCVLLSPVTSPSHARAVPR